MVNFEDVEFLSQFYDPKLSKHQPTQTHKANELFSANWKNVWQKNSSKADDGQDTVGKKRESGSLANQR